MRSFKVRCYALKRDGIYFSASITLNLTASGNTLEEAQNNLEKLIRNYLRTITKNRKLEQFEHLLNRPVPAYMYIDYLLCYTCHYLSKACSVFNKKIPYTIQFAH